MDNKDNLIKTDLKKLREFVYNAWLGKCISGNIGFNLECYKEIFDFKTIDDYAPTVMYPNDDLDIQLAWIDVLLEKGANLTSKDLLEKFIDCYHFDFSEYGYAKRNFKRGLMPPHSGAYNNYFKECMGCPIRAEIWGLSAVASPELAASFAEKDAVIDHTGESVEAEKFIAAMEAASFYEKDIKTLILSSLKLIKSDSMITEVVTFVLNAYEKKQSWLDTAKYLHKNYGSPDGTYVVINMGIMVAGLLYGGDNFDRVMTLTLNGGYDTDCTCATAGAIYAMVYGVCGIDKKWIDLAGSEIITATKNLKNNINTFDALTDATVKIICGFVLGHVNNSLSITGAENFEPLPKCTEEVLFETEYLDGYEISPSKACRVMLKISNHTNSVLHEDIKLSFDDSLNVKSGSLGVNIESGESKEICLNITLKDGEAMLSDKNIIDVNVGEYSYSFGIVGSSAYRLIGCFSDGFDHDAIGDIEKLKDEDIRIYGGKKYIFHTDPNEYTNNWIRFDHEYISEKFEDSEFDEYFNQGERYSAENDNIALDKFCSKKGSIAVYAFQKLYLENEKPVELHIGSSDPYKIWINGELVAEQRTNWFFSPYNQRPRVTLKKGINRIAIKLIRNGKYQDFAYVLREEPFNHVGAISTDIKYIL